MAELKKPGASITRLEKQVGNAEAVLSKSLCPVGATGKGPIDLQQFRIGGLKRAVAGNLPQFGYGDLAARGPRCTKDE